MQLDETRRLCALEDYRVLDTPPEEAFDNITQLASRLFRVPIVLVTLVDATRQWFKSRVGMSVSETPREYSFCDHAIRGDTALVVPDARLDERFRDNPLVTGPPGIRFYCGVPLRSPQGYGLGTLCIIDRVPRSAASVEPSALQALARQVEIELELRRRLGILEEGLHQQQHHQRSKELLASMIVHDLRSPLTAVIMLLAMIRSADDESREAAQEALLEAERMRLMLGDVLDICLHEAHELTPRRVEFSLQSLAERVSRRLQHVARQRRQELTLELPLAPLTVFADPALIERVLENLVSNASHHGPAGEPIVIAARNTAAERVRIEVRDRGELIRSEARSKIFDVFGQLEASKGKNYGGHGLGLAFCRFALEAHAGSIAVEPHESRGNCFHFELPSRAVEVQLVQ